MRSKKGDDGAMAGGWAGGASVFFNSILFWDKGGSSTGVLMNSCSVDRELQGDELEGESQCLNPLEL